MPIPSYPENRREEYLNNIATGSGEIPPYPENREEQYLDAIAKNGGGGGSGGGVLVVHVDAQTMALDKTWQEIVDAGFAVLSIGDDEVSLYELSDYNASVHTVGFYRPLDAAELIFAATSADDYPVYAGE